MIGVAKEDYMGLSRAGVWGLKIGHRLVKVARRTLSRRQLIQAPRSTIVGLPGFRHTFCGYYDHSPFLQNDETLVLVHATDAAIARRPDPSKAVVLSVLDWTRQREVERLGRSYAWNWQQGCRLHWMDRERYVYNVFDVQRNDYGAVMDRIGGGARLEIPYPVQETHASGKVYTISFAALQRFRPDYGYSNRLVEEKDIDNNGLQEFDVKTGGVRVICSIADLKEIVEERMQTRIDRYKINHVLCAPSGWALAFVFRYCCNGRRITDLVVMELTGRRCLVTLADCSASHYCWISEEELLFTGRCMEGSGYIVLNVNSGERRLVWAGPDGHPVAAGAKLVVSDSYPDNCAVRRVLSIGWERTVSVRVIGEYVEPWFLCGETRCDLHPSLSPSRELLQIDTVAGRERRIAIVPMLETYV